MQLLLLFYFLLLHSIKDHISIISGQEEIKNMRHLIISVILFILFTGCTSTQDKSLKAPFEHFLIAFEQDGTILPIENHQVNLRKAPFAVLVYFTAPDSLYIHASTERKTFDLAAGGSTVSELPGFEAGEIQENLFNSEKTLHLSETAPSFWKYTSKTEHNFSEIKNETNVIVCRRTIDTVTDHGRGDMVTPLEKISSGTVFLSMIKMEWNEDYSKRIEKKRQYFILSFNQ